MGTVIGVDTSTQSCTVEVRDLDDGRVVGRGSAAHPRTTPPVSEQDPESWWSAFLVAAGQALAGTDPAAVRAIAVDAQCHGLVLLDAAGRPLRPAKLWNDTTSSPEAAELVERYGAEQFAERAGTVPTAALTVGKLLWVARHETEVLDRAAHVLVPHDYMNFRLTGRAVTDRSDASGTGYYSAPEGRWLDDVLALVDGRDWSGLLPAVLGPEEPAGTVLPEVSDALGLSRDVLVGPGAGDQHAAALGLGVERGDVVVSLGTSGVVFTSTDSPVADPSGWISGVADASGGYLPLVCTLNAAKVTDAAARWLGVDLPGLADLADRAPVGDSGLTYVTYLDGERSPNRPHARGVLHGMTTATTREQIARSAFEGVLLGLLAGWHRICGAGVRTDGRLLVTGGGARASTYRQILADLGGRDVLLPHVEEASARGACIQAAAVATGATVADTVRAWRPETTVAARPRPGADPAPLIARYQTLADWRSLDDDH